MFKPALGWRKRQIAMMHITKTWVEDGKMITEIIPAEDVYKKEWKDLTNDEIVECQQGSIYHFYRCIVLKLKEKNVHDFGSAIDLVIHQEAINERLYKEIAELEAKLREKNST